MNAVMAMHIDRAGQGLHRLDHPHRLVTGHAVIADGQVDVADTEPLGGLDVRCHAVDADDGPDAELLEGRQGLGPVRVAAAIEPRAQAKCVLDAADFEPLGCPGLALLGRLGERLPVPTGRERDQEDAAEERADPQGGIRGFVSSLSSPNRSHRVEARLVAVGADDLAAGDRAQGTPGRPVDGVLDEPDAAVAEQGVHPAGMVAPGRDRRVRGAALFSRWPTRSRSRLGVRRVARGAAVRRPGGGDAGLVDLAVAPLRVAVVELAGPAVVLRGDRLGVGVRGRDRVGLVDVRQAAAVAEQGLLGLALGGHEGLAQAVAEVGQPPARVGGERRAVDRPGEPAPDEPVAHQEAVGPDDPRLSRDRARVHLARADEDGDVLGRDGQVDRPTRPRS